MKMAFKVPNFNKQSKSKQWIYFHPASSLPAKPNKERAAFHQQMIRFQIMFYTNHLKHKAHFSYYAYKRAVLQHKKNKQD